MTSWRKNPGDLVTVADQLAEQALTSRLLDLDPGSAVVGEEAVAANHTILERAAAGGRVWIIDPIDGTGSFARGATRFAVMVALLDEGRQSLAGFGSQSISGCTPHILGRARTATASRLNPANPSHDLSEMTGDVRTTFFVDQQRLELLQRFQDKERVVVDRGGACGYVYPELATGELDFAVFGRQYPGITRPERFAGGIRRGRPRPLR